MNETTHTAQHSTEHNQTLPMVRAQVKEILTRSQAFRALPKDRQQALAKDMVKVAKFITGGEDGNNTPAAYELAGGTQGSDLPKDLPKPGDVAGEDFKSAAAEGGAGAFTNVVREVNFPKFVAG